MKIKTTLFIVAFLTILPVTVAYSWNDSTPLIIDHTCTDLSQIPDEWIDSVQTNMKMYYVHTSHGGQLTDGLETLELDNFKYSVAIGNETLPTEEGAFCVHDKIGDPKDYWYGDEWKNGPDITRQVLNNNPDLNVSIFCWCTHMNYESEGYVQEYLDSVSMLEDEFPNVTFVYMTGNANANGERGYNRYLRNNQMRQYCIENNRVLFDFADIDCWWFNPSTQEWEFGSYEYGGYTIPMQHLQFQGDECGHASYESCIQKARAVWWMMAKLAGCTELGLEESVDEIIFGEPSFYVYTNPLTNTATIAYELPTAAWVSIQIYNGSGQLVNELCQRKQSRGYHQIIWKRKNLPNGVYFCQLRADKYTKTKKVVFIK